MIQASDRYLATARTSYLDELKQLKKNFLPMNILIDMMGNESNSSCKADKLVQPK
jgi:hypothetical protein